MCNERSVRRRQSSGPKVVLPELHTLAVIGMDTSQYIAAPGLMCFESRNIERNHYPISNLLASKLESIVVPGFFLSAWNDKISPHGEEGDGLSNLRIIRITQGHSLLSQSPL